ncbi:MAG: glycosyltransferase family 2 protein [Brevibacterium aurantiacum]|nr:glycosyltransferase family 2 protein [Brevibacterium aurantiacum]
MNRPTTVSVVIPVYNEEERIAESLATLDEAFAQRSDLDVDLLIVNDGSVDHSLSVCERIAPSLRHAVTLLTHDINQGLGGALRTGIAQSTGAMVVVLDSDLSYGLDDIMAIIDEQLRTHAHVVIASPYMPGGKSIAVPPALERRSRMANAILSWAAIGKVYTLTGMVRAYDGEHIRAMSLKAVDVDINSEIVYKTQLLRGSIVEVPATLNWSTMADRAGRSSLLSRRSRWNTAKSLVNAFLFRPFLFPLLPLPFLLVMAFVAMAFGGGMGVTVGVNILLFGGFLALFSVMMLQLKRYFEELFSVLTRQGRVIDHPRHARLVIATEAGVAERTRAAGDPEGQNKVS